VVVRRQVRDLGVGADRHCATSTGAASAPPGAAVTRATDHTVARPRHLPHRYHRCVRAARHVTLTQIIPSVTASGNAGPPTRQTRRHARRGPVIRDGRSCDAPARCDNHHRVSLLEISVAAGESGPVLSLSGEADVTTAAELSEALTAQLADGARHLMVDLSGLRFADSSAIRALVLAGRTLKQRGGALELANPQPVVARALSLLGVDQAITIRGGASAGTDPER